MIMQKPVASMCLCLLLMLSLFALTFMAVAVDDQKGFIGLRANNTLVIQPPTNWSVSISNFTELLTTKAELSSTKSELSSVKSELNSTRALLSTQPCQLSLLCLIASMPSKIPHVRPGFDAIRILAS